MALIHEELYRGGGFERLNFSPYVEELAGNIFQTYRLGKENIRLNLYIDNNVFFNIDVAVPLGMIINELVSNAFKHAFQGRNEGLIQIKLQREEIGSNFKSVNRNSTSATFALTISDNGVGIPSNLDIEALDSLGLQLVTSLVSQLDGKLEIKRSNGTEFIIRFAISDKNNHVLSPLSQHAKNKTYT
jgi:two-component sensor histidine kinase